VILVLVPLCTLLGAIGVAAIFGVAGVGSSGAHGRRHLVDADNNTSGPFTEQDLHAPFSGRRRA
jgi:hypothetical protein